MQKARSTFLAALRAPIFSIIGDAEQHFEKSRLSDLFELIHDIAA